MSEIRLYFALVFFVTNFNHQKCDLTNGDATIILSSDENKKIRVVLDLAKQNNEVYKVIENVIEEKKPEDEENSRKEEIRRDFLPYFSCALKEVMKPLLKITYDVSIPLKKFIPQDDIPPIPQDLIDISQKHDMWLNNVGEMTTIQNPKYPLSEKWKTVYKTWYRFAKYDKEFCSKVASFVQTALNNLKTQKKSDYKEHDVHVKFSAEMARCYGITCVLHYNSTEKIRIKAREHNGNFAAGLLELAPTWYLTKEAVRFMNILLLSRELTKANDDESRREIKNNFKHIECMMVKNKLGEKVCVPFLDTKKCYIPNAERDKSSILSFLTR